MLPSVVAACASVIWSTSKASPSTADVCSQRTPRRFPVPAATAATERRANPVPSVAVAAVSFTTAPVAAARSRTTMRTGRPAACGAAARTQQPAT